MRCSLQSQIDNIYQLKLTNAMAYYTNTDHILLSLLYPASIPFVYRRHLTN